MRVLRGLAGVVLWLLAAVVGLLGALLSVTVVLLPVGIPLLLLARKLFTRSVQLLLPRKVAHPVQELGKKAGKRKDAAMDAGGDALDQVGRAGRKAKRAVTGRRSRRLRLG